MVALRKQGRKYEFELNSVNRDSNPGNTFVNLSPSDVKIRLNTTDIKSQAVPIKGKAPKVQEGVDLNLILKQRGLDIFFMQEQLEQYKAARMKAQSFKLESSPRKEVTK